MKIVIQEFFVGLSSIKKKNVWMTHMFNDDDKTQHVKIISVSLSMNCEEQTVQTGC